MSSIKRNLYLVLGTNRLLGVATSYKKAKELPKKGAQYVIVRILPEHLNERMNACLCWK